jgi:hypothetical protein
VIIRQLWTGLPDKFKAPQARNHAKHSVNESSHHSAVSSPFTSNLSTFIFGGTPSSFVSDTADAHPIPMNAFTLWQAFLNNVNPLSKLIYVPKVQDLVLEAIRDHRSISPASNALIFAIYAAAVMSMKGDECQIKFSESKDVLMDRYLSATQKALGAADFIQSTDLEVLQAFVIYIIAIRPKLVPETTWLLSGMAFRMSQRVDLSTPKGEVSVFEAQMRSRVAWYIVWVDGRLCGSVGMQYPYEFTARLVCPANLNDADINPSMVELPRTTNRHTEMSFCLARYEVGQFLFKHASVLHDPSSPTNVTDELIDELEKIFEIKYVRHCDMAIPLHRLTIGGTRSVVARMRLMAHHPSRHPDKGKSMSQAEHEMIFLASITIVEMHCMGHKAKDLENFCWHIDTTFQLDSLVFMLIESQNHHPTAFLTQKAWDLVADMFHVRPELMDDKDNELYASVRQLALKAWRAREIEASKLKLAQISSLPVITTLRMMASGDNHPLDNSESFNVDSIHSMTEVAPFPPSNISNPALGVEVPEFTGFDDAPGWEMMDWTSWNYWDDLFQTQNTL